MDATDTAEIVFEVPKGSTAYGIGPSLVENGLVPGTFQWKRFVKGEDASCLKAGKFSVNRAMSMRDVLQTLCAAPIADDVPFTVVEGWRIRDIDEALAAKGFIEAGAYKAVAEGKTVDAPFDVTGATYEGYLWPETYMVQPPGKFNVDRFVVRQLDAFNDNFVQEFGDRLGDRSLHDVVVVASMLEREEPSPANRPLVSGIIWKRLDKGWQLGIDATSRYTIQNWNDRKAFLKQLRDPDDPYNTRLRKGLPPTAIGNPAIHSLEGAVSPKSSEYWYYLHDSKQTLHPARNAAEHDANRKKFNVY
jgi:UPF0755 protein